MIFAYFLALIPIAICQTGVLHSSNVNSGDPCILNPCKDGEICITRGTTQFACVQESAFRNLLFNATANKPKNPVKVDKISGRRIVKPVILPNQAVSTLPPPTTQSVNMPKQPSDTEILRNLLTPTTENGRKGNLVTVNKARNVLPTNVVKTVPVKSRMLPGNPPLSPTMPVETPKKNRMQLQRPIMRDAVPDTFSTKEICDGLQSGDQVAHPFDNSKFIICNQPSSAIIMSCPLSLRFNSFRKRCDYTDKEPQLACLSNPCKNGGRCVDVENYNFKCECLSGFEGETCDKGEDPCSWNPCGPTGVCKHFGFVSDSIRHYCLCDNNRQYGWDCDRHVSPNPCLSETHAMFYPVEFSDSIFIHCESQTINFKACNPPLVWSSDIQGCDRRG